MLTSGLSNQLGAAAGAHAFGVVGPIGVVAVRQWIAGLVLLLCARPRLHTLSAKQWRPVIGLAAAWAVMNTTLYVAVDRIGLGLAVTLEFLGPLAVALASSRRLVTVGCAAVIGAAVLALARPQPSTDYVGIASGLAAAGCWASYILLNRTIGQRIPGSLGLAAAVLMSSLAYVPVGVVVLLHHKPTVAAAGYAVAAGLLASVVPIVTDLLALRRVDVHTFGLFMSFQPVLAALVGLVLLGQALDGIHWAAIIAIVAANCAAAFASGRTQSGTPPVRKERHDNHPFG